MAPVISHDRRNLRAGEDDTLDVLERELPDHWELACTVVVPDRTDARELDVLAISDRGIYVVEVKNHRGYLTLTPQGLLRSGALLDQNPYGQVDSAAKVVATYLKRKCPELAQQGGKPVHAHLVFSNPEARLVRVDHEIKHQVSTLDSVADDLIRRDEQGSHDLSPCRKRLRNLISNFDVRDAVPPRILSYTIGERLSTSAAARSFQAVHDDGSEYVLRLIRPKNSRNQSLAARERDGLLREYEVLRKLEAKDVCPRVHPYQDLDEGEVLVPIQTIEGRSLAQEILDGTLPQGDRVVEVVSAAFRALAIVHETEPTIVHRAITPERVIIAPSGTVKFTDFQIAHIDEQTGYTSILADFDPDDDQQQYWRAPEARQDLSYANTLSDVWALATTLKAWVIGSTRSQDLKKNTLPGEARDRLGAVADRFAELLRAARANDQRPSATEIANLWGPLAATPPPEHDSPDANRVHGASPVPLHQRELAPGDVIGERYELIEVLEPGSTAATYLVRDLKVDERIVLKSFDFDRVPENLALEEFRKARELVHEHIATVREYHPPPHPYQLVIDHAAGTEAGAQAERFRGDAASVSAVAQSLLEALGYIHDKGYLHRDVSPRNVVINDDDPRDLKLIDFGMAALEPEGSSRSMGTFGYAAPEVVRGAGWTPAADVYSAGVLLFRLLTGSWPFRMAGAPIHDELIEPPSDPPWVRWRLDSLDSNRLVGLRWVNVGGLVLGRWDVVEGAV